MYQEITDEKGRNCRVRVVRHAAGDVTFSARLASHRSKTTQDGVEAARMSGIDSYLLRMEPELVCDSDDLDALMDADALVITLPARRSGPGDEFYLQAVQELVDSALAHRIPRIIFTSSTSVYGDAQGTVKETTRLIR